MSPNLSVRKHSEGPPHDLVITKLRQESIRDIVTAATIDVLGQRIPAVNAHSEIARRTRQNPKLQRHHLSEAQRILRGTMRGKDANQLWAQVMSDRPKKVTVYVSFSPTHPQIRRRLPRPR